MPGRLTTVALTVAVALALPAAATAAPSTGLFLIQPGSPLAGVESASTVPRGFGSSARQAVAAAEQTQTMRSLHRRMHPLNVAPYVWRSTQPFWYIVFTYHGRIVADANVSRSGKVTGVWTGVEALAPYSHADQPALLTNWLILLPASLLFMLPFLDPRRLCRIALFDGLAALAFLVSFVFISHAELEPAVWLAYPPLIYLLLRMLKVGFRGGGSPARLAPLLSTRTLIVGLPLLLLGRIVLSLTGHIEIDVGYQSVFGAFRILHHLPIYYGDPNHGDTYGPIAYLAYVPFELVSPWTNSLNQLHAADAAAIVFDLGTIAALIMLGRRLRAGAEGARVGLVLAWAWAACPFTVIGLLVHTNDALISMLSVLALLLIAKPALSGGMVGLAAAAKFSPAGLVPLLAAPRQRGPKGAAVCVAAFTAVTAAAVWLWLPPGGLHYFWQRTIGFQMTRLDVFSPWGLHPSLHPLQIALEVLAVTLAAAVAFLPRERSLTRVCALAGAVTIAIQLPATHWYYYYVMWFLPFALVALLVGRQPEPVSAGDLHEPDQWITERDHSEPVLVGV
jgi:hypothetical protein